MVQAGQATNEKRPLHPFLREVADQLYASSLPTTVVGIVVSILLTIMLWPPHGGDRRLLLAIWLAAVQVVYIGRFLLAQAYFRAQTRGNRPWLTRFRATVAVQGALWGLSAFVLFPTASEGGNIAYLFAIAGLTSGSAIAFGIDTTSMLWFELPFAAPLAARLFTVPGEEYAIMGLMVMLFLAYVSIVLPRSSATIRENLRLRLQAARRERDVSEDNLVLNCILDNEPECVKIIRPDGSLQMMNKAGLAMLEVDSVVEANETGLANFVHPDDRKAFMHLGENVLQGISGQLEFRIIGKRGGERWLQSSATALRTKTGEITGILAVTRNVTGRKQAEDALRRSEQRYRLLSSATFEGIVISRKGRVVDANEQFALMLGYTRPEVLGRLVSDFLPPEDAERVRTGIASGEERIGEFTMVCRDGTHIVVDAHGQTFENDDGEPMRMAAVRDITSRKQAELALQKSEQRFRMLSTGTFEGVLLASGGQIVDLNEQYARMLGYSREEMLGRMVKDFIAPDYRDFVAHSMGSGQDRRAEVVMQHRDGHRVTTEAHGQSYEQDGVTMRLTAIRDVTERKEHEARLRESRQLLDSIVEHIPNVIFLKDAEDMRFVMFNAAAEKMMGVSRQEMLGKDEHDIFPPEQAELLTANDRAVLASPPDQPVLDIAEDAINTPMGVRVMHTKKLALRDEHGTPRYLLGISEDITERKQHERALRESEEKLRGLYEMAPLGIALTDLSGRFVEFNEAFRTLCGGYTSDELKNLDYWALTPAKYQSQESKQLELLRTTGHYGPYEKEFIRKDGTLVPLRLNGLLVAGRNGHQYIWSIVEDISDARQAERDVRIAATAFEAQEGMMVTDANVKILQVNKAFTKITGYTPADVAGRNPSMLSAGRNDKRFYDAMWQQIRETGSWSGEVWNRRKDGETYPEHLTVTSVKNDQGEVINYVGTLVDITQRKASEEEIQRLAFYDHLTGLPNRRLLMDRMQQSIVTGMRVPRVSALLFIDLDNFKHLNDSLGHDYGDMLLQQIAHRLEGAVRQGDTVARLGGDEFVVLLEEVSTTMADAVPLVEGVARKVLETLGHPYDLNGTRYASTPSIGVTLIGGPGADAETALKQADIAMYQAKNSGRNTVRFFDQYMQDSITRRSELENDLRSALANREISLHFQVQVTAQRKPVGAEALVRWRHPHRGMVPPDEFIPLAEESGLIVELGRATLEIVCAQLKTWENHPQARQLSLSVNVGARQFREPDFSATVGEIIRRHGINPGRLKLELSEATVLQNIDDAVRTLTALNDIGVQLAIDDFGTGYSSLQYLKRLPLDQVKIDRSFVREVNQSNSALAVVQTIIAMADSMGLDLIAEGVETEEQYQVLHHSGCIHFQGYLFGVPLPLDEFEAALARRVATVQ